MRLVVFGLAVSSSWGNGHAALWRGMIAALTAAGHQVTFFERDFAWYAQTRDLDQLPDGGELVLYSEWPATTAAAAVARADIAMVTSYCPDAIAATSLVLGSRSAVRCFYDLDTPVTLARLQDGETVDYLGPDLLRGFDIVLSYTGGAALDEIRTRLGASRVAPLYGWVDPDQYQPAGMAGDGPYALSYLGTYAADRQEMLEQLFVMPARALPERRFVIGGAQYPDGFPWQPNIFFVRHVPPPAHPAFYAGARMTLNVTRGAMARMGWCPSGRLFEAGACATPMMTDRWDGLDSFFAPGEEILVADTSDDVIEALRLPDGALAEIGARARARVLDCHTAAHRARDLLAACGALATA